MKIFNRTDLTNSFVCSMTVWAMQELRRREDDVEVLILKPGQHGNSCCEYDAANVYNNQNLLATGRGFLKLQELAIFVPSANLTDGNGAPPHSPGRVFLILLHMGLRLRPDLVPPGPTGLYRQPIGAAFTKHQQTYMEKWLYKAQWERDCGYFVQQNHVTVYPKDTETPAETKLKRVVPSQPFDPLDFPLRPFFSKGVF